MEFKFNYGKDQVSLRTDHRCVMITPVEPTAFNQTDVLERSLGKNFMELPTSRFFSNARDLLIIVNDATRPNPLPDILPFLEEHINERINVRFLIATGTHRPPTHDELSSLFRDHFSKYQHAISIHDSRNDDEMIYLGNSRRGTEVKVNRQVLEADSVMTIGNVKPHYFAGFAGGRKSILPGIASYKTVERNHSLAMEKGSRPLALDGNPVSEDMDDALHLLLEKRKEIWMNQRTANHMIYSIQTVLTHDHRIFFAASGDMHSCFNTAIPKARQLFTAPVNERSNIVISVNPYPMDINLYQSQHAIENAVNIVEENGIIILISKCRNGVGNQGFLEIMDMVDSPEDLLTFPRNRYKLGFHKLPRIMRIRQRAEIWAVTGLNDHTIHRALMEPHHDVQEALDDAVRKLISQGRTPKIAILPAGGMTVPVVEGSGGS